MLDSPREGIAFRPDSSEMVAPPAAQTRSNPTASGGHDFYVLLQSPQIGNPSLLMAEDVGER